MNVLQLFLLLVSVVVSAHFAMAGLAFGVRLVQVCDVTKTRLTSVLDGENVSTSLWG